MKSFRPLRVALAFALALVSFAPAALAQNLFVEGDALSNRTYNSDGGPTNSQLTLDFPITQAGILQNILTWGESSGQNISGIGQSFELFVLRPLNSTNYQVVFATGYMTVTNIGTNIFAISGTPFGLQTNDVIAHYGRGIPFSNGTGGPSSVYIAVNLPPPMLGNTITVPGPVYPLYNDGGRNYAIQIQALGQPFVVSTNSDSGSGSLRQAVLDANAFGSASTINFATNLSGQTITLTSGQIVLNANLTIDASALAKCVTINGNNASRIFNVAGGIVVLNSLAIINGTDAGSGGGGGILNYATLTLNKCTLAGNTASDSQWGGGGILSYHAMLTLNECTLAGNSANNTSGGGGILNLNGTAVVNQCTLAGNSANNSYGGGIGSSGALMITNSIVANNTAAPGQGADIFNGGNLTFGGVNLVQAAVGGYGTVNGTYLAAAAELAPLGNYGGPTPTMPPLPGSPVINGCTNGIDPGLTMDQRGYPRIVGPFADIGAVELETPFLVVTTSSDNSNANTLRNVLARADTGSTVTFTNTLSGQTITLTNGQIVLNNNVTIDGSSLANGVTINGNNAGRIFNVAGGMVVLNSLVITNGTDAGSGGGGGIVNYATLTLNKCTLAGNTASDSQWGGGGILSYEATLTLNECTLAGNSANNTLGGGGIFNDGGTLTVNQCTLAGNSANGSHGGGIENQLGALMITNSIVASNAALGSDADIENLLGNLTYGGVNLVQAAGGYGTVNGTYLAAAPDLAPLGNYGGPTPTMPPLPGSPVINGCTNGIDPSLTMDQRGYPRIVGPFADIGAVELQTPFLVVTTSSDNSNTNTLRNVLAGADTGSTVTFTNTLSGQTITLTNGQIVLNNNVTIDGSSLPGGIAINGNNTSRIFLVTNATVVLNSLTITNGNNSSDVNYGGGGILNQATLTLNECTLAGNSANNTLGGGGIYNDLTGTLTVNQCTLAGNTAVNSYNGGGGILNFVGKLTLNQSTLAGNAAGSSGYGGGGLGNYFGSAIVGNSIIAGNTAASGADIFTYNGSFTFAGSNLVQTAPYIPSGSVNGTYVMAAPDLAPLGNYGGPTPTMLPLIGSPAIDRCTSGTSFATDQRGLPRIAGPFADIGAVEFQYGLVVSSSAESGENTLRAAAAYAPSGSTITFATNLSGQTIKLTTGQIALSNNVSIDATAVPGGIAINGSHTSRIFSIGNGAAVGLNALVLSNGYASNSYGGAISNSPGATTVISNCLLISNTADIYGGGILNNGTMTVANTTLAGNHAGNYGGGINNDGTVTVNESTIAGNSAGTGGGGISSGGHVNLIQSTLTANTAGSFAGGIHSGGAGALNFYNSIVAGNSAPGNPDLDNTNGGATNQVGGSVQLAGLGYYGGPTPTMPPLPGSSLINAGNNGVAGAFATDQRGFPRTVGGNADLGAVEVQSPAANRPTLRNITWTAGGGSSGNIVQITFTNTPDADFTVLASTNVALPLTNWTVLGEVAQPLPGQFEFTDLQGTNYPLRFYRVRSP